MGLRWSRRTPRPCAEVAGGAALLVDPTRRGCDRRRTPGALTEPALRESCRGAAGSAPPASRGRRQLALRSTSTARRSHEGLSDRHRPERRRQTSRGSWLRSPPRPERPTRSSSWTAGRPTARSTCCERTRSVTVVEEPGANIARGRNLAIAAATHDVIAVADADCRYDPDWLEHLLEPTGGGRRGLDGLLPADRGRLLPGVHGGGEPPDCRPTRSIPHGSCRAPGRWRSAARPSSRWASTRSGSTSAKTCG